jgi:hypothetical protein
VWGEVRALDLVASRRLTLAARASHVACLVLRTAATPSTKHGGNALGGAVGVFVTRNGSLGRADARRAARPQPSRPAWAMDHGVEM